MIRCCNKCGLFDIDDSHNCEIPMDFDSFRRETRGILFSGRTWLFNRLLKIARDKSGVNIAWPDAILFLSNQDVIDAIRLIKGTGKSRDNP